MGHQKPKQGQAQAPEQRKQSERELQSEAPMPGPTQPWFQQQQILLAQRTIGNRQVVRRISSADLRRTIDAPVQPPPPKKPLVEDLEEPPPPPKNPDAIEIDLTSPPPRGLRIYPVELLETPPEKLAKAKEEADKRRAALPATPAVLVVDPQGTAYSEQEADEHQPLPATPAVVMVDSGGTAYAAIAELLQQVEHNAESRQALLQTSKDKLTPYLGEFPRVVAILKAIRRTRDRLESGDIDMAADLIAAMEGKKGDLTVLAGAIDREPDLSALKSCIDTIDDVSRLTELLAVTKPARINPSELLQLSANAQQWLDIFAQIDKPDQIVPLATALTPKTLATLVAHDAIQGRSDQLGKLTPLGNDARLAQWLTITGSVESLLGLFERCQKNPTVLGQLLAWVPDGKRLDSLLTKVNGDAALLSTLSQTITPDQADQLIGAYATKQKSVDLKSLKDHVSKAEDDGAYLAALHEQKVNQGDLLKFLTVPLGQHKLVMGLLPYEKDYNQIQALLKVSVVDDPAFLELFKEVGDSKTLLAMLEAIDTKGSPLQVADLTPLIALAGKVGDSKTALELVKAVPKNQLAQIPAMLDRLKPDDLVLFAKNANNLDEITGLLAKNVGDPSQLKKIINPRLKVAQLKELIDTSTSQPVMLKLAERIHDYTLIKSFLHLEKDEQALLDLAQTDKNSQRLLNLLQRAGSRQTLEDLRKDEKDHGRLLALLKLADSGQILQNLFAKDKDHARLEESLQLLRNAGQADGQLLLDMLTKLGGTQVAMAPNDLAAILKPLLSDGLTGPEVQTICTKLAEDGKTSAEIRDVLSRLRGNLTAVDPNKPNNPATKPITDVPQQTAQDITNNQAVRSAGKQVLSGPEILASVNDAVAGQRGAATIDTHFPTGEAIPAQANALWHYCVLANQPNPAETPQQALIRQKLALRALMKLHPQNADIIQAIFAHNQGQGPRAIFPPDVEDTVGAALGAHIVDRHVLNNSGAVGTQQDVKDRAMGQGKFANNGHLSGLQHSPAGAFNDANAARAGMQLALQQQFPMGSQAWANLRGLMVTGHVDLFNAAIAGVNSHGYVAENQNNVLHTTNAPTGVHLRLKLNANAPGGFSVHSAWPVR